MIFGLAKWLHFGLICGALLLAACTPIQTTTSSGAEPERGDSPGRMAPSPERRPNGVEVPPAVAALVAQAETASVEGRNDEAAAHLERALRVAPQNAVLWQNLAVVRYRQDDYDLAESLALKSNDLAGDDVGLQQRNWRLIATVRRLQGNNDGAAEAERRAQALAREADQ